MLVRGLNALTSIISTPLSAPVLGPVRLRGGSAEAIGTARECGCSGMIIVQMDSAYCNAAVIRAIRRKKAYFPVTVPVNSSVRDAAALIPGDAWTAIRYPRAIYHDQPGCWVSDAQAAEIQYTAFTSKPNKQSPRG